MIPGIFSWAAHIAHGPGRRRDAERTPCAASRYRTARTPTRDSAGTPRPPRWPWRSPRCSPGTATPLRCRWSWIPASPEVGGGHREGRRPDQDAFRPGRDADQHEHHDKQTILEAHRDPSQVPRPRRARDRLQRLFRQPLAGDATDRGRQDHCSIVRLIPHPGCPP